VASNHLVLPMGTVAVMVPMLKARYDALPAQAKAALDKHSGEALARRFGGVVDQTNDATRDRVAKNGKSAVVVPSATEQDAWRKAVQPVSDGWRKARAKNDQIYAAFVEELKRARAGN
jgi:TRAP-type C4-dicarboxylate transport system substrate-binding protein